MKIDWPMLKLTSARVALQQKHGRLTDNMCDPLGYQVPSLGPTSSAALEATSIRKRDEAI